MDFCDQSLMSGIMEGVVVESPGMTPCLAAAEIEEDASK